MKLIPNLENKEFLIFPYGDRSQILVWEFDMEKANGTPIYWLGSSLGHLLGFLATEAPIQIIINAANNARNNLTVFINLEGLPLSKTAAKQILENIDKILSDHKTILGLANPSPPEQKTNLRNLGGSILHFQSVLSSELPQINIFYVAPHRAYDMTMLIEKGENLLSPVTLNLLGSSQQEVIKDIREAARCLAFGFSTAVGFHLYRAIEAIIVEDYFNVLKVSPKEWENNKNLGKYIKILEGKGVDAKITIMLSHLKDRYRNPIMHPDEFWDSEKSTGAIGSGISIIDMMVQEIEEIKKRGMP